MKKSTREGVWRNTQFWCTHRPKDVRKEAAPPKNQQINLYNDNKNCHSGKTGYVTSVPNLQFIN